MPPEWLYYVHTVLGVWYYWLSDSTTDRHFSTCITRRGTAFNQIYDFSIIDFYTLFGRNILRLGKTNAIVLPV